MKTNGFKTVLVIGVIGLFLGIAAMPAISHRVAVMNKGIQPAAIPVTDEEEDYAFTWRTITVDNYDEVSVFSPVEIKEETVTLTLTEDGKENLVNDLKASYDGLGADLKDYVTADNNGNENLKETLKGYMRAKIDAIIDKINNYIPNENSKLALDNDTKENLTKLLIVTAAFAFKGIVSAGAGIIVQSTPLPHPNMFLGLMIMPIKAIYVSGATVIANLRALPPRFELYYNFFQPHTVTIAGFLGLYVGIGRVGKLDTAAFMLGGALIARL
jgi:hypothetical protein